MVDKIWPEHFIHEKIDGWYYEDETGDLYRNGPFVSREHAILALEAYADWLAAPYPGDTNDI